MATASNVQTPKDPRKKTPAQLAKIAANKAAYDQRNEEIAMRRLLANVCRKSLGYVGAEAVVIEKGERFVKNCRSLYGFTGTDLLVLMSYLEAVELAKKGKSAFLLARAA